MLCDSRDDVTEVGLEELREAARRTFELGRKAWPQIALEFDTFNVYFARHARPTALPRDAHAADMYLACACGHAIGGALEAFERTFAGDLARAVASIDSSDAFVGEILQVTRERLFVPNGSEPGKVVDYAGRASLRSWLCAIAVRSAISARRRKADQRHEPFAAQADRRLARGGPEFEYLRARYKGVFEDAVRNAVERLPSKERMLLRLHLADGMSIDKLATVYRVGRSTAARWLASARRALLEQTRRELHSKLRLTSTELDGLAEDMRSQLEVSIVGLLAGTRHGGSMS